MCLELWPCWWIKEDREKTILHTNSCFLNSCHAPVMISSFSVKTWWNLKHCYFCSLITHFDTEHVEIRARMWCTNNFTDNLSILRPSWKKCRIKWMTGIHNQIKIVKKTFSKKNRNFLSYKVIKIIMES